jgi:hypothetical protein
VFAAETSKTKEGRMRSWSRTIARIVAIMSVPVLLCTLWLNIADNVTLRSTAFVASLRQTVPGVAAISTRSLIVAALNHPQLDVRPVYEALYPAQTTQYVALLLIPGLIDEIQGDVRPESVAYIIDQRLPVVVRDYVHDAPLCTQVQERQIMAVIEMPAGYAVDVCRPVMPENEAAVVSWLTATLQTGFNAPEPEIQGIIYPQRVETQERMVYTRFSQYTRYSSILAFLMMGIVIVTTGLRLHASMRWLGVIGIATGILGVSMRAVTESGQAFDGAVMLQQYSRQAAATGLPLGVLIRVLADPSFRDWSIISACIVLFAGTIGVGLGALQPMIRPIPFGSLTPMEATPSEESPYSSSLTAVVPTVTVTDALPAGLVTNPLEVIRDDDIPPKNR